MLSRSIENRWVRIAAQWGLILAVLGATYFPARFILGDTWKTIREEKPVLSRRDSFGESIVHGVVPGIAGGLQNLMVDLLWLRMHHAWSERETAKTQALLHMVTAVDPGSFYFWRHGARIMAYDIPVWRIESMQREGRAVTKEVEDVIRNEQAARAIQYLERAATYHPENPEVWIEIAQIQNNILGDMAAAAATFKKAWEMEGAPYFTGRLHAELLRRSGQPEKAYQFYRDWHPSLPEDDPRAAAPIVLKRIRELENALGIPNEERYQWKDE